MKLSYSEQLTILTALETEYLERERNGLNENKEQFQELKLLIQRFRKVTNETAASRGVYLR